MARANAVESAAAEDESFVQVAVDTPESSLTVYLTGPPDEDQRARYEAAAGGASLRYATARLSRRQVQELDALVSGKRNELVAHGLDIRMWGMSDGPAAPYVITYRTGTPTRDMMTQFEIFGPNTVMFRRGEIRSLGSQI
jgi:hypothetical protein